MAPVVTIDGPSGSGKGTVARGLARCCDWRVLDSGALYRTVGLAAIEAGIDASADLHAMADLGRNLAIEFATVGGEPKVYLDQRDVTDAIRTERAGEAASRIAALPDVRTALLEHQRAFAVPPGLVADGRDMGSVVFPEAVLKVYLTASAAERASRRYKQLKDKGIDVSLSGLARDIRLRDKRDANRAVAPLAPAVDARIIDSTQMSSDEVIDQIKIWLREAGVV